MAGYLKFDITPMTRFPIVDKRPPLRQTCAGLTWSGLPHWNLVRMETNSATGTEVRAILSIVANKSLCG